jgi:hypothetical protein
MSATAPDFQVLEADLVVDLVVDSAVLMTCLEMILLLLIKAVQRQLSLQVQEAVGLYLQRQRLVPMAFVGQAQQQRHGTQMVELSAQQVEAQVTDE